jgi:hypothetical protein
MSRGLSCAVRTGGSTPIAPGCYMSRLRSPSQGPLHVTFEIMATFGYAPVCTRDQDVAAQVAELMTAGGAKVYRGIVFSLKIAEQIIAEHPACPSL